MSDIKVRVGQQNTIRVVSSISGSAGGKSVESENVIGGIASVTTLRVSGVSSFYDTASFYNGLKYENTFPFYNPGGISYFDNSGMLVSTGSTSESINYTNYILTTSNTGISTWSNTIDGGTF
jgi:hypothetical protein